MSQTMQTAPDTYLMAQKAPPNKLEVDPKYHNIRLITPIGRFQYIHVDAPFALKQKDGSAGKLQYSATMFWFGGTEENPIVADLHKAITLVADAHWPAIQRPDANGNIVNVPGSKLLGQPANLGGLHYPLRSGSDSWTREPDKFGFLRGMFFINVSMQPQTKAGQPQRPITIDEKGFDLDPTKFYPGCYGRMDITCAPFDAAGNKGVTFFLNGVQFARHGEMLATSNPGDRVKQGFANAGAIEVDPYQQTGYGANTMHPGNVPPGAAMGPAGFAAPPPQQLPLQQGVQQQERQPQQAGMNYAPQNPVAPNPNPAAGQWAPQQPAGVPGAARPPGV
jgi:hypothetical protein